MSRAQRTAKLAAKLAESVNAGGITKGCAPAVTVESMLPLAAVLARVDRQVKRNGRIIRALIAAEQAAAAEAEAKRHRFEAFRFNGHDLHKPTTDGKPDVPRYHPEA